MTRREFSSSTKREALKRSGGLCEAKGLGYGLQENQRCNSNLGHGVEFDHRIADSIGGNNDLDNCFCLCKTCHAFKSFKTDIPRAAKTKRMSDKHRGITKSRHPMPCGRGSKFKKTFSGRIVERD
jgi:5-methylcytosine-specific restriction enzyme A